MHEIIALADAEHRCTHTHTQSGGFVASGRSQRETNPSSTCTNHSQHTFPKLFFFILIFFFAFRCVRLWQRVRNRARSRDPDRDGGLIMQLSASLLESPGIITGPIHFTFCLCFQSFIASSLVFQQIRVTYGSSWTSFQTGKTQREAMQNCRDTG